MTDKLKSALSAADGLEYHELLTLRELILQKAIDENAKLHNDLSEIGDNIASIIGQAAFEHEYGESAELWVRGKSHEGRKNK